MLPYQVQQGESFTDYMNTYKDLVTLEAFKNWYGAKLNLSWLKGASISEITEAGLITLSNSDAQKNDFQQAEEAERKRLEKNEAEKVSVFYNLLILDYNNISNQCCTKEEGILKRSTIKTRFI